MDIVKRVLSCHDTNEMPTDFEGITAWLREQIGDADPKTVRISFGVQDDDNSRYDHAHHCHATVGFSVTRPETPAEIAEAEAQQDHRWFNLHADLMSKYER